MTELLAPVGNFSKLKTALYFGADAVYAGGKNFSLRNFSDNFSETELIEAVNYCHSLNKKIYVTVNIYAKESQLGEIKDYLFFLNEIHPDGIIISDLGVLSLAKKYAPALPLHISTQANTLNSEAVNFYRYLGVSRVNLAREISIGEIKEIGGAPGSSRPTTPSAIHRPPFTLECFVHGAMCIAYSGRCLLSGFLENRSANGGECVQACRWNYEIRKASPPLHCNTAPVLKHPAATRHPSKNHPKKSANEICSFDFLGTPKEGNLSAAQPLRNSVIRHPPSTISGETPFMPVEEDKYGSYILNGKDLNMLPYLDKLIDAGVTAFKIEGRMKSEYYLATVVNAYRRALDNINNKRLLKTLDNELYKTAHREYTTAFYFGENDNTLSRDNSRTEGTHEFIAIVLDYNESEKYALLEMRNRFYKGDKLEVLSPGANFNKVIVADKMLDSSGEIVTDCKLVQEKIKLFTDVKLQAGDILRRGI